MILVVSLTFWLPLQVWDSELAYNHTYSTENFKILMPKLKYTYVFAELPDSNKINETHYYLNQACHLQHQLQSRLRNNFLTFGIPTHVVQTFLQQQVKHTYLNMINITHLTAKLTP